MDQALRLIAISAANIAQTALMGKGIRRWVLAMAIGGAPNVRFHTQTITLAMFIALSAANIAQTVMMGSGIRRWVLAMVIGGATTVRFHPQTILQHHWRTRQMTRRVKSLTKSLLILRHARLIHWTINWLRIVSVLYLALNMDAYKKSMWVLCSPSLL